MASNLNSEFNYRYQVIGSTPWEKIKTLQGFYVGRKRAAVLEEVAELKYQAKLEELKHLKTVPALPHIMLNLQAEIIELESHLDDQKHAFELNRKEIKILEKYMAELYAEVEPTRLKHPDGTPYTDDEMFEANANYEFTVTVGREIQSEIISMGRPSPAKLLNAMSNPQTLQSLMQIGLILVLLGEQARGNIASFNAHFSTFSVIGQVNCATVAQIQLPHEVSHGTGRTPS
jgi:hypothetical protein